MTEAEIIEGNTLIAHFMGMELEVIDGHSVTYEWVPMQPNGNWCFKDPPPFNKNWLWLMPVVEKINTIFIHNYGEMGVYIKPFTCYIGSDETDPVIITTSGNYPKLIEMVWSAVVTFIRWYNQNSKA